MTLSISNPKASLYLQNAVPASSRCSRQRCLHHLQRCPCCRALRQPACRSARPSSSSGYVTFLYPLRFILTGGGSQTSTSSTLSHTLLASVSPSVSYVTLLLGRLCFWPLTHDSTAQVHAKGAGAHGVFEVTHDITDLTCASLFSKVGNTCPVTARFSTVGGELGSADSARDPRGTRVSDITRSSILIRHRQASPSS